MEGDVAETEGGHDRERPVNASDPGVILPLNVVHDQVETGGKECHSHHQQKRIAYQSTNIGTVACWHKERQQ